MEEPEGFSKGFNRENAPVPGNGAAKKGERKGKFIMISRVCHRLSLILILLFFSSCVNLDQQRIPEKEGPAKKEVAEEKKTPAEPAAPARPVTGEKVPDEEQDVPVSGEKDRGPDSEKRKQNNQELLDSALDFCQASNDFWESGDLDNALDALDKAYSLILKVTTDDDPEVLQQKEDLRFTISKRIIEVYSSRFTVANGYHNAIPLVMNHHVKRALDLFKGRERGFFLDAYRRSGTYRPAIVAALREAGLPEELSWLPLIESGFKLRALSRARALGMWQFIASTGYKFGLKRDAWIDERMDPEKSTRAAIAYLKELHQIFGDWTTVLAAYNCGEGAVLKRIKTQRINYLDNFWDLYMKLPTETAFYVPKFLAVLHILNAPEKHGFTLPPVEDEIGVEEVTISKQVHLKTIANRLGMSYELLKDVNPELRQYLTPDTPYPLKVPAGKGEVLLAKLSDIPVWSPPVAAYIIHRVRKGDTLSSLAMRYRTSVRSIMAVNRLSKSNYLKVGWRLKIPTRKVAGSPEKPRPPYTLKQEGKGQEYVVRRGDSLWTIANRYDTTTKAIQSLNRLEGSTLAIGQVLMISPGETASGPVPTKTYRVRAGDSPYLIAKRHKMNLAAFLKLNNLTPRSTIFPGQPLRIRSK
jgi:membrane-bound lytic murein transglycosylase D